MTVMDTGLDELLASPEFITDPYPVFRRLREESPVHSVERWGCWLPTRAEGIELTIRDTRRFSSAHRVTRVITQDAEIGGVTLQASDIVRQALGSADRHPARFDDPDVFRIERPPARHLSFGRGHHFCMGAPLVRLQAQIVVEALLRRLPGLHPDPDVHARPDVRADITSRGLRTLHLAFDPPRR